MTRFAFEGDADGLVHPPDLPKKSPLGRRGGRRRDFLHRFPTSLRVAPVFARQLEPAFPAMNHFFNFVISGRDEFVLRAVGGAGWKEHQFVPDIYPARSRRGRFGRGRQTIFEGREKFHDR